jgi:hypothetical protein
MQNWTLSKDKLRKTEGAIFYKKCKDNERIRTELSLFMANYPSKNFMQHILRPYFLQFLR